jgi:hypothetical protein
VTFPHAGPGSRVAHSVGYVSLLAMRPSRHRQGVYWRSAHWPTRSAANRGRNITQPEVVAGAARSYPPSMRRPSIVLAIGLLTVAVSGCSHGHGATQSRELSISEAIRLQPRAVVTVTGVPLAHAGRILFCSGVRKAPVGAFVFGPQCDPPSLRVHGTVAHSYFTNFAIAVVSLSDGALPSGSGARAQWQWTEDAVSATGRVRGRDFYVRNLTLP